MRGRKFSESMMEGTCSYCAWGYPRVIVCRPLSGGAPFPTLFWLSCPWLVLQAGRLESEGGVRDLEEVLLSRRSAWINFNIRASLLRLFLISSSRRKFMNRFYPKIFDVLRRTEVGGIYPSDRITVKCLHLQVAAFLAMNGHPGSDWLLEKFPALSCPDPGKEVCGLFPVLRKRSLGRGSQ
ncbi:MAG: DUF501 domain-containing protein [Synergistales bacterium]|nr:DUF501 domain-containing protein [Synergistales bacterium]